MEISQLIQAPILQAPPHDPDAEMSVLGSLLLQPDRIDGVAAVLDPEDFYILANSAIFTGILELNASGVKPDIVSLNRLMSDRSPLQNDETTLRLMALIESTPSSANCDFYVDIVRSKSIRRELLVAGRECINDAMRPEKTLENCVADAERYLTGVLDKYAYSKVRARLDDPDTIFAGVIHELESEECQGRDTGFPVVDDHVGGMRSTDMIVLAGRPSQGKTTLALNICENTARQGKKVILFTLETSREEIYMNFLASNGGAYRWKMTPYHRKDMSPYDKDHNHTAHKLVKKLDIVIRDEKYLYRDIRNIRSYVSQQIKKTPVGLVVIDQFTLLNHKHGESRSDLNMQVTSKYIQAMCKDLGVPVLLLHQLSRAVEKEAREPRLSDLRECGSLEEDADAVIFIQRPKNSDYKELDRILYIAKAKLGSCGRTVVTLNPKKMVFTTPDYELDRLKESRAHDQ